MYAGNYLGSLEAIDAGVTTLLDWSHINNTPEHADEAIRGLRDARLRAVYCYGNPNTSLADWWYTSTLEAPEDIRRVRDQYFSSDDGLMTLAMGTRGPGFCTPEVVRHDWELAREVGAPISVHVGMGPYAGRFSMVSQLSEMGLLGADTTYIHCNYLSDDEFRLIADSGGMVSISPTRRDDHGPRHAARRPRRCSTGSGRASASTSSRRSPGDMFTQMRFLFASDRLLSHEAAFAAESQEEPTLLTCREVLEFATIEGARVCGLADRTGSLTPGQAGRRRRAPLRPHEHLSRSSTPSRRSSSRPTRATSSRSSWPARSSSATASWSDADLRRARDRAAASLDYLLGHTTIQPHWVQSARATRTDGPLGRSSRPSCSLNVELDFSS